MSHERMATSTGSSSISASRSLTALRRARLRAQSASAERFLSWPMGLALVCYSAFAVTFASFQVKGDGLVYFNLLRRYFGEHPDFAFAYQFGSDVWNTPFFLVGRGLGAIFGFQPTIFHVSFEEISITAATQAAFVLTLYLGWRLLRELDLPRGPAVLFLTTFGSPLFYYVVFDPAMKHAVDTLVLTAATLFLLRVFTRRHDRDAIVLGALVGLSLNIRYVNVAFFFAVACALAITRRRALAIGLASAAVAGGVIFALPALRGISYFVPSYFPKSSALGGAPTISRYALGAHAFVADTSNPFNGFSALTPLKMLFSAQRGLFIWTPLTAVAVLGILWAFRRVERDERWTFRWTLVAASTSLLLAHSIWGFWNGAFSFSTRFLTALFPLFLIGIADLRLRVGARIYPLLCACAAWSLLLAFVHLVGYDGINAGDTAFKTAHVFVREPGNITTKVQRRATDRWSYLWALTHGRDPEHVHGR
jgi:hypothetical protein